MRASKLFVGAGLVVAVGAVGFGAALTATAAPSDPAPGGVVSLTAVADGNALVMCATAAPTFEELTESVQVTVTSGTISGTRVDLGELQVGAADTAPIPAGAGTFAAGVATLSVNADGKVIVSDSSVAVREGSAEECNSIMAAIPTAPAGND